MTTLEMAKEVLRTAPTPKSEDQGVIVGITCRLAKEVIALHAIIDEGPLVYGYCDTPPIYGCLWTKELAPQAIVSLHLVPVGVGKLVCIGPVPK